jgi:hypothetical protein
VHFEADPTAACVGEQVTEVPDVKAWTEGAPGRMSRKVVAIDTVKMSMARETPTQLDRPFLLDFDMPDKPA